MLPKIDVRLSIMGQLPEFGKSLSKTAKLDGDSRQNVSKLKIDMENETRVYTLYEDEEYALGFSLARTNRMQKGIGHIYTGKAYTPKYSKPKDENWIIILGENTQMSEATNQLVGLKRVNSLKKQQTTNVMFRTPLISDNPNRNQYILTVYLISDCYIGLDQQFEINIKLVNKP